MNRKLATICETDDYSKFKFLDANRPVTHAKKIMESIQDIGVLWQPILVNENFEIIDGQGRFMAMKTLGKPIVYVVQPGLGIKHVRYGLEDERGRQQSYKKLKRKYLVGAIALVKDYVLPIALANEVEAENEAGDEE